MAKYYWLKLKKDFFHKHDVKIIEAMPNGKDYVLFYLKLLCESTSHDGNLRFSEEIPYNEEMLSALTNTNIDIVRSAVKVLSSVKLMEMLDDGTYFMTKVNEMIGSAANNDNANRQRRFRERKKQQALQERHENVTTELQECYECVTKNNEILDNRDNIEKETISKDIVKKKNATNVATLTQKRKDEFYESLIPFLEKYDKEMVREFFDYWTETNRSESKMRFEMEKTWDTTRRLSTWAKRDNKFNSNGHRFDTTSNYESATERKRREQQEYAGRLAEKISQRISNSSGN